MPVSPTPSDDYYFGIAQAYQEAELEILGQIRDRLNRGQSLTDQEWATARLAEIQQMRKDAVKTLGGVNRSMASKINGALGNAYKDGAVAALKDTEAFLPERSSAVSSEARQKAVSAIYRQVTGGIVDQSSAIVRQATDDYAKVVRGTVARVAAGGVDRRTATSRALKEAFGKGLMTGPVNKRGSRMSLPDYIEMSMRTGVAKSLIAGHLDTLAEAGVDLVYIQPGPRHCERCDDWANRPLWRHAGSAGTVQVQNVATGNPVSVQVYGSLDDARLAGWGHPNCRCSVSAYLPGATDLPVPRPKWDEKGYEAQQKQRGIERQIRDAKIRAQLATDLAEKAKALREVAMGQASMRAHLDANPVLKRQSKREQVPGTPTTPPSVSPKPPKVSPSPSKPVPATPTPPRSPKTPEDVLADKVARDRSLIENAAKMYGDDSPQHRQIVRKLTDGWDERKARASKDFDPYLQKQLDTVLKGSGFNDDPAWIAGQRYRHLASLKRVLEDQENKRGAGKPGTKVTATFGEAPGFTLPMDVVRTGTNPGGPGWATRGAMIDALPAGYGTRAYSINCTRVAAALEMRVRGYDVEAAPIKSDAFDNIKDYIEANWKDKEGDTRHFHIVQGAKDLEEYALSQGEGSRFFISIAWKSGGAHIFNAEVKGGELIYREAQISDVRTAPRNYEMLKNSYNKDIDWIRTKQAGTGILRVDDLFPQDSLVDRDWIRPVTR